MMNRLWVRLSLAFGLLVLMGPFLLGATALFISLGQGFLLLVRADITSSGGLINQLETYYAERGHWQGVEALITSYEDSLPRGPEQVRIGFILRDASQNVLYQSRSLLSAASSYDDALPITINGRTRALLTLISQPFTTATSLRPEVQAFLIRQVSRLLAVLALVSGIVGLAAGIFMSRTLTAPLARLAVTVQAFGPRDLTRRAAETGSLELRQLAQAFNQMADNIAAAENMRRTLMADVAHELRTPLTVLQANLQALQDGVYPLEQDEIAKLMQQTHLLMTLVHDLHELAQAEAQQLSLQRTPTDIVSLIRETLETFRPLAQTQRITLTFSPDGDALIVTIDSRRIVQVLHNLLQNALTHTPAGGQIVLTQTHTAMHVILTVQDSGSGIAAAHLPHIFDRFYRVDPSRSRASGGAGLGLAIVKAMVILHGGTITATSASVAGAGTCFQVVLPR